MAGTSPTTTEHPGTEQVGGVRPGTERPRGIRLATEKATAEFDLIEYARRHRYRTRNLHDGRVVPPAQHKRAKDDPHAGQSGYVGVADRWDAVVGRDGYIADEGELGRLGIALFFRSAKGVNRARAKIEAMGGTVTQEGDTEIAGTIPVESIDAALKLIRVSKVPLRNPRGNPEWAKTAVSGHGRCLQLIRRHRDDQRDLGGRNRGDVR